MLRKSFFKDKIILECVNCGKHYTLEETEYLCPLCSNGNSSELPPMGVLKTLYDYTSLGQKAEKRNLFGYLAEKGFIDLLPINSLTSLSNLHVGNTPLYRLTIRDTASPPHEIFLKDDSQNPTFSYKDRASNLVSAVAKEKGISSIITASTGNAGSSMAGIGAAQHQKVIVLVPENAPLAKLIEIAMYGAKIVPVRGSYDDAFDLSVQATAELGIYNRNTAYNPFTIEGKKTAAFEIYSQMGEMIPDRVFVPVGDGCIIAGIYKGFEDLLELGLIDQMPEIVAVQAKGSSNLINNIRHDEFIAEIPDTMADSISVRIPRNYYLAKQYILKYEGQTIAVSDDAIRQAVVKLAGSYGIFAEPAAAAAYAGYLRYRQINNIGENSHNVILLTGSGLKDIKAIADQIRLPESISPSMAELKEKLL